MTTTATTSSTVPRRHRRGDGRRVEVDGRAAAAVRGPGDDPAVGTAAPALTGTDYAGNAVDDRAGHRRSDDGRRSSPTGARTATTRSRCSASGGEPGGIPEGLQVVGVSTAVSAERAELPAGRVARREGVGRGRCSPTTPS